MASLTIEQTFSVDAPPDRVWSYLTDPERVVTCLPGATLVSSSDDGRSHEGTVTVKLGAIGVSYRGSAEFLEADDDGRRLRVRATGREKAGAGSADMSMEARVLAADGGSEVAIEATVNVTGKLVSLGRGMIDVVSEQLVQDFAAALQRRLSEPTSEARDGAVGGHPPGTGAPSPDEPRTAEPANAFSILVRAIWLRLRRLFGRD